MINKKLCLLFLLPFLLGLKSTSPLRLPIISVYDGDTIRTELTLPIPLNKVSVRIKHIDTPEIGWRAKCIEEKDLANKALFFLRKIINKAQFMTVTNYSWDKYGGRIDGDVFINKINVGRALINAGYARYYKKGKRQGWCDVK